MGGQRGGPAVVTPLRLSLAALALWATATYALLVMGASLDDPYLQEED